MIRNNKPNFASRSTQGGAGTAPASMDFMLFTAFLVLIFGGIIMIYGASSVIAYNDFGDSGHFFKRQILWSILGLFAAIWFFRCDEEKLKRIAGPLLIAAIILMLAVKVPGLGKTINGATRWLKLGPFTFQPSELAKLAYVLFLAVALSDRALTGQKKLTRIGLATAFLLGGLALQKDFGGSVIILSILVVLLFVSGLNIKYFIMSVPVMAAGLIGLIITQPYRIKRLLMYLDPWKDYYGAGWQPAQSMIAIGSGGITGVGLSNSLQKYQYLPVPYSDYIFSIIGEELGLIGCAAVLAVIFIILYRGMLIAVNARDEFLKYAAAGVTIMFTMQSLVNIGVATGLLPSKGTTLPFLSYGGTSVLAYFAAAGILLSVSGRVQRSR